jgi:hypothetical protein
MVKTVYRCMLSGLLDQGQGYLVYKYVLALYVEYVIWKFNDLIFLGVLGLNTLILKYTKMTKSIEKWFIMR